MLVVVAAAVAAVVAAVASVVAALVSSTRVVWPVTPVACIKNCVNSSLKFNPFTRKRVES